MNRVSAVSQIVDIEAGDGHSFQAIQATRSDGLHRGGVVVLEEVFGLTSYIKSVGERFAEAGYLQLIPSLYDRIGERRSLDYSEGETAYLVATKKLVLQDAQEDIASAVRHVVSKERLPTGLIGLSYGATLGWILCAACH